MKKRLSSIMIAMLIAITAIVGVPLTASAGEYDGNRHGGYYNDDYNYGGNYRSRHRSHRYFRHRKHRRCYRYYGHRRCNRSFW